MEHVTQRAVVTLGTVAQYPGYCMWTLRGNRFVSQRLPISRLIGVSMKGSAVLRGLVVVWSLLFFRHGVDTTARAKRPFALQSAVDIGGVTNYHPRSADSFPART